MYLVQDGCFLSEIRNFTKLSLQHGIEAGASGSRMSFCLSFFSFLLFASFSKKWVSKQQVIFVVEEDNGIFSVMFV